MNTRYRVCIIGLDGVNASFLNLVLGHLVRKPLAKLVSTIPPYTPPAWTSIFTGVNPGMHNIFGFLRLEKNLILRNNSWNVSFPRLFEMLAMHNVKSIVVNVPLTYPINSLGLRKNYIIITDWTSPLQIIWPYELTLKYREKLSDPPHKWWKNINVNEYTKNIYEYIKNRVEIYLDLFESSYWDVFIIVFSETDWLLHKIPELLNGKYISLVNPIFNIIKKFVKKAIEICDLVLIVSDHGFEKKYWFVNINRFLSDKGLLKYKYKIKNNRFFSVRYGRSAKKHSAFVDKYINIYGKTLDACLKIFINVLSKKFSFLIHKYKDKIPIQTKIDFNSSIAYMIEAPTWGIYLNKKSHISLIKRLLFKILGISAVYSSNEIYHGPYTNQAPDIIVIPKPGVYFRAEPYGNFIGKTYRADHNMYGIFMIVGDNIDETVELKNVYTFDIVPTILYYLGLPLPSRCDGRPLKELFTFSRERIKRFDYLMKFKILRIQEKLSRSSL